MKFRRALSLFCVTFALVNNCGLSEAEIEAARQHAGRVAAMRDAPVAEPQPMNFGNGGGP